MSDQEEALHKQVSIVSRETVDFRKRMTQRWLSFLFDLLRDDLPLGRLLWLVRETEKVHETNTVTFGDHAGAIASAVAPLVQRLMAGPPLQEMPTVGIPLERHVYHRKDPDHIEEVRAVRVRLVGFERDSYLVWGDTGWNNPTCMGADGFEDLFAPGPTPVKKGTDTSP